MCPALWIPAYAGMTVRDARNDGGTYKGEGDWWLCCLVINPAPHLWIADQVRNDGLSCPAVPALWIDESPITLCQRVRF